MIYHIIWLKFRKVQTLQISPPTNPIKEQKSGDSSNNLILRKGHDFQHIIIHDIFVLTWRSSENRWRDWWQSLSLPTWAFNAMFLSSFSILFQKVTKNERNWMAWFFVEWYQLLESVQMETSYSESLDWLMWSLRCRWGSLGLRYVRSWAEVSQ